MEMMRIKARWCSSMAIRPPLRPMSYRALPMRFARRCRSIATVVAPARRGESPLDRQRLPLLRRYEGAFVQLTTTVRESEWPDVPWRVDVTAYPNYRAGYTTK